MNVTHQLLSAMKQLLDGHANLYRTVFSDPARGIEADPDADIVRREAIEALTAYEASRAAPDDVVERVAQAILAKIVERKREIAGRASLEADEFDVMCAHEDARAALSAMQPRDEGLEALRKEEAAHLQTIDERDIAQATADRLADLIAKMTGVEIGEHSAGLGCPGNDPHLNAIDAAEAFLRNKLAATERGEG